jgi:hypothetical protein
MITKSLAFHNVVVVYFDKCLGSPPHLGRSTRDPCPGSATARLPTWDDGRGAEVREKRRYMFE